MSKTSKRKGKAFEQQIAHIFRIAFEGTDVRRGWQARMGSDAPDVVFPGLWVECKHRHVVNIPGALAQAQKDAQGRAMPVAITRKTGAKDILCTITMQDFIHLLKAANWCGSESTQLTTPSVTGLSDPYAEQLLLSSGDSPATELESLTIDNGSEL